MSEELKFSDLEIGEIFVGTPKTVGRVVCCKLGADKASYSYDRLICTFAIHKDFKVELFHCVQQAPPYEL